MPGPRRKKKNLIFSEHKETFPFLTKNKIKSENSLNMSNYSHITLHCDTHKTQHRNRQEKKKMVLTGGDFKRWAIKQRIIKYPTDLLEHLI